MRCQKQTTDFNRISCLLIVPSKDDLHLGQFKTFGGLQFSQRISPNETHYHCIELMFVFTFRTLEYLRWRVANEVAGAAFDFLADIIHDGGL